MKATILTFLTCLFLLWPAVAQDPAPPSSGKPGVLADAKPSNCAYRTASLDGITQEAAADELIIVIARSGEGDTKPGLNRRRLHNVRAYWSEFIPAAYRRRPETIVLAEGERVNGLGRIEFYIGGKLFWVDKVARNADLRVGLCYAPDDSHIRDGSFDPCEVPSNKIFYPCRDPMPRRKGER